MTDLKYAPQPNERLAHTLVTRDVGEELLVPAGKTIRLLAFNFDIKLNAEAGKRVCGYEICDKAFGKTLYESLTGNLEKPSELYGICGFIGAGSGDKADRTTAGVGTRTINLPLPNIWLPPGWWIQLIAPSKLVGDSFPLFRWLWEERDSL